MHFRLSRKGEKGDLENGHAAMQAPQVDMPGGENLGEYENLVRYISTYRETRRVSVAAPEEDEKPKKRKWYMPWKRSFKGPKTDDSFVVPDEWLETDIKQGLSTKEVELRRRKTGFNELTTEKENFFLKILSYFQGPILYGKLDAFGSCCVKLTCM